MNKSLTLIVAVILCVVMANAGKDRTRGELVTPVPFREAPPSAADKAKFTPWRSTAQGHSLSVGTYTTLEGWYDYQTNGGANQYVRVDSASGNIHVIYMLAEDSASVSPSRRTGYALSTNNGATWNNFSNVRVPTIRSGFPSMDLLRGPFAAGTPIISNHNVGAGETLAPFVYVGDSPGSFVEMTVLPLAPFPGGEVVWPFIGSGSNGRIIVHASDDLPPAYQDYITSSTDFGSTWSDPWITLPTTLGSGGRSPVVSDGAGRVATIVRGDTVVLYESTNDGATWPTPGTIVYPPLRRTATESLTVYVGTDLVYLGNQPLVALNTSYGDGAGGNFLDGARIEVWGPTLGFRTAVPWDPLVTPVSIGGQTNHLGLGYPSIGMSGSIIVIVYTQFLRNDATIDPVSGKRFGEIFLVESIDGGVTWSQPVNLTNTPQLDERYPSIAKWNPAGFANITWQEDTRAGSHAFSDNAPISLSRQVFLRADLGTIVPVNDITALAVTNPGPGGGIKQGDAFAPKAAFRNLGLAAQTGIPVRFEVLNSSNVVVYSNDQTVASLASGATQEVTFATVPGSLTNGLYRTRAKAQLVGDQITTNDSTSSTMNVIPIITVSGTYTQNFEDSSTGDAGFGWYGALDGGSGQPDWVRGTPSKPQITGPHGGTKCFVTRTADNYSSSTDSYLSSPVFDLTAIPGCVTVGFWQNFYLEPKWDTYWLQYSTNGGTSWIIADHALGTPPWYVTASGSTYWYNEDIDSSGTTYLPPAWSRSSTLYAGHASGWIHSQTVLPIGGQSDVRLRWYLSADAAVDSDGVAIDDVTLSPQTTVGVGYTVGWNMLSLPVGKCAPGTDSVLQLYPGSAFNYVFGFGTSGYFQSRRMFPGIGYWGKFNTAGTSNIAGAPLFAWALPVTTGWNMVGSISGAVDTASIIGSSPGLKASQWFGFSGGYTPAPQILPGKGYWVKASAAGSFLVVAGGPGPAARPSEGPALADLFNSVTIRDSRGSSQTLYFGSDAQDAVPASMYDLPPTPPAGAFDVRFESKEGGTILGKHARAEGVHLPITIQSTAYPIDVQWSIREGEYMIGDAVNGLVVSPKEMRGTGTMRISNPAVTRLVITASAGGPLPTEYALLQNYPNPFNPSTTIKFALPEASKVTVEIYNLLGQRVNTLMSEGLGAGYHEVKWNGTASTGQALGSGVYFVRFSAKGVDGKTFSDVRKVMLMK